MLKEKRWTILGIGFVATIAIIAILIAWPQKDGGKHLRVCSWGGTFQESQRKAFFEPFSTKKSITITESQYSGESAKIKAMVQEQHVTWDIVDVEDTVFILGAKEGIYEPIDYSVVNKKPLMEETAHEYGVVANIYSTVLAFNTELYPNPETRPQNWTDFWNVKKYPGPRALRRNPKGTLEFALLADGVQPENLYPLDVDRALKKLSEIKPHIKVWWTTGQQPVQLLMNKEVVLASAFSGRIWNAKNINNLPLWMSWDGGLLEPEWWVMPKGSENKKLATEFIAFAATAEPQAKMSQLFGVGPSNKDAFKFLPQSIIEELPTSPQNRIKQVRINSQWWSENEKRVQEVWNEWLLK